MDLRTYAEQNGGTGKRGCPVLAKLAAEIGCSAETLYMIGAGHKRASGPLTRSISRATGEKVAGSDLRPDIFGPTPTASAAEGEAADAA